MSTQKITTTVNADLCNGCGLCVKVCPSATISIDNGQAVITGSHSMNCGHCEAVCPTGAIKVGANDADFSYHSFTPQSTWLAHGKFSPALLDQLLRSRRSCRNYTEAPVSLETLQDLIRFGISAPSGTNSQQWTFTVLPTRAQVVTLGNQVADFFADLNKKAANPAFRLFSKLFCKNRLATYYENHYQSVQHGLQQWYLHQNDTLFHGAPAAIIIAGSSTASCPAEDALMASQNILLGAHSLGLGSCMIGFAVHAANLSNAIKPTLLIPKDETVYACIGLGYPNEHYRRLALRKKPVIRIPS